MQTETVTGEFIVIPADSSLAVVRIPMNVLESLDPIHEAGVCELSQVECLTVKWHSKDARLFVHGEGRLLKLPVNPRASAIYANGLRGAQDPHYRDLEADPAEYLHPINVVLVGDAVLFTGEMK